MSNARSGNFTRNNCGPGGTGGTVTYTIAAGSYTSSISQDDADTQAANAVLTSGQAYANANASCSYIYYSNAQYGNWTRNNCGPNGQGEEVVYTIPAGSYTSTVSQSDADGQALAALNAGGQAYANANGGCAYMYYSNAQSGNFTRNNCGANGTGGTVTYFIPQGSYTSATSQTDADALAIAALNAGGQAYANANAGCSYLYQSNAQSGNFTRNNCGTNGTGSTVTYTIVAGSFTSSISQGDADSKALAALNAEGPGYANLNAGCSYIYYSAAKSGNFTKNNCSAGGTGGMVTFTVPAGRFTSNVSQEDADVQAANAMLSEGPAYANMHGSCIYYNTVQSRTIAKNDCGNGGALMPVVYTVAAGTYSASSQAAADQLAINDIDANGQAYANLHGSCALDFTLHVDQSTYAVGEKINIYFNYTGTQTVQFEVQVTNPDGSVEVFAPQARNIFRMNTMQSGSYMCMGRTINSSGVESSWLPVYFSVN